MRRRSIWLKLVVVAAAFALMIATPAIAANVYAGFTRVGAVNRSGDRYIVNEGFQRVGYISSSFSSRWNVYSGFSRVGYVSRSFGGRWNIYEGFSRVGYVSRGFGTRWNIYEGFSRVGYVEGGPGSAAAGAALLLLLS
jgi:hypothetical protein